jgi:MarR family 2-MHQ and catechol resistance regulon transcriptional repressor
MLLKHQFPGGTNQMELSRRMLVNRANVTGLIDRLERDGLVGRSRARGDRRSNLVRITSRGIRRLDNAEPRYFEGVRKIAGKIPARDRRKTMQTLLALCRLMETG